MARIDSADVKRYFTQKKAESDKVEDLIEQRAKTVAALQRAAEERFGIILERENMLDEREKKLEEKEKNLAEKEHQFKQKQDMYDPLIIKWEQEKQDLLQKSRIDAENCENEVQAAKNETARLKKEILDLEARNAKLQEEKSSLLRRLL